MPDTQKAIIRAVRLHLAAKHKTQVWLANSWGSPSFGSAVE